MGPTTPPPVDRWKLRTRTLTFGRLPRLMGVVNVTPDSFSDGGQFFDPQAAIDHGLRLAEQGADLLDVGGESTRPGAEPVSADEELRRVMPVVAALCEQAAVPVSIDTSKAAVAREALQAGVEVVNDVTALGADPAMIPLVAEAGCGVCAMHMQGTPRSMQLNPTYDDVVAEMLDYLRARRDALADAGVEPSRIALDPGIGFGKTTEHNLELLRNAGRLHELGCPVLVGHSRKRFIGQLLRDQEADRTPGTIAVALALARRRVQVLRVHDVGAVRGAMVVFEAAGGVDLDRRHGATYGSGFYRQAFPPFDREVDA